MCWIPYFEVFINVFKAYSVKIYEIPGYGMEMEFIGTDKVQIYFQHKHTSKCERTLKHEINTVKKTITNYRYYRVEGGTETWRKVK